MGVTIELVVFTHLLLNQNIMASTGPLSRASVEILLEVFTQTGDPCIVSAVCTQWRNIVENYPAIWRTIRICCPSGWPIQKFHHCLKKATEIAPITLTMHSKCLNQTPCIQVDKAYQCLWYMHHFLEKYTLGNFEWSSDVASALHAIGLLSGELMCDAR